MDGKSDFGSSLAHGLVGYWDLDETSGVRADSLGTNPLSPTNTPGYAAGVQGNCVSLVRASNQLLKSSTTDGLRLGLLSYTFALWFNATTAPPAGKIAIALLKGADISNDWFEYSLFMDENSQMITRMGYALHLDVYVDVTSPAVTLGVWHLAVVWHNSVDKSMSLQIDNGKILSATVPNSYTSVLPLQIGGSQDVSTSAWNGYIDEVGVWNRCLSWCETKSLYNNGSGTTYPFSNTGC